MMKAIMLLGIGIISLVPLPVRGQTLQQQVDACASLTTCVIDVPPGVNVVTKAWNLRDKESVFIRGHAAKVIFQFTDPAPSVCIDTSGTLNIVIEGLTFGIGATSVSPGAIWGHSRPASKLSQTRLHVSDTKFVGRCTKAVVALFAVENGLFESADFANSEPNTTSLFMSRANELGLTSQFGVIRVDPATMTATNNLFENCSFGHDGHAKLVPPQTNDEACGLTLGTGVHDVTIIGGSTSGGARGAVLCIDGPDNRRLNVIGTNWEAKNANNAIRIRGSVYGLAVAGGLLMSRGPAVLLDGSAEHLLLEPLELLCDGLLKLGPAGKLAGRGMSAVGVSGN